MILDEVKQIANLLKENNFKEISFNETPDELDNYLSATEIARRLKYRLQSDEISQLLIDLGYKTFIEKVGVPTNPENGAFSIKFITDDETLERKYYIQSLWTTDVVNEINSIIDSDKNFLDKVPSIQERNKKVKELEINNFKSLGDFVSVVVKKTGFNEDKDFVIYLSLAVFKSGQMVSNYVLPVNDGLDDEKIFYYYDKEPITGMSPFDYIKVDINSNNDSQILLNRKDVLRSLYKILKGMDVVYYNIEESRFIKKMFESENIPKEHSYENIIGKEYNLKGVIDWLDEKQSLRIKDVYYRYQIPYDNSENKYLQESKRLGFLVEKIKERVV